MTTTTERAVLKAHASILNALARAISARRTELTDALMIVVAESGADEAHTGAFDRACDGAVDDVWFYFDALIQD